MEKIGGSCLCGGVTFEIKNDFENFQWCHCTQCQKSTGTAHASNLFTSPENINWSSGEDLIVRFDVEGRRISNVFCKACGCRVPYLSGSGKALVVPAGCLDDVPSIVPQGNIFWSERASWYDHGVRSGHYDRYIE